MNMQRRNGEPRYEDLFVVMARGVAEPAIL